MKHALLVALAALATCACKHAPPAYGEIVLVVDTDVPVPTMVSRLRVDLFTEEGVWFESRDYPARDPREWPLSFSVYTERPAAKVRVRLRAFPEARTRPYVGERFVAKQTWTPPQLVSDLEAMCAAPTTVEIGRIARLRTGPVPFLSPRCAGSSPTSATAVRFHVERSDLYTFGGTDLEVSAYFGGTCAALGRAAECPIVERHLDPGTYDLVVGAGAAQWSDFGFLVAPKSDWPELARGVTPATSGDDRPRLLVDGADLTPSTEPVPDTTIDRILDFELTEGARRSARVVLRGACMGTMADLAGGRSCVDTDGTIGAALLPLDDFDVRGTEGVRDAFLPSATCSLESTKDRVCIPGGAFLLGSREVSGASNDALFATPERPVRVAPFVIDRTEVSWRRLRALVARGLASPKADPDCVSDPRDDLPVTCVDWRYAREACRFDGGDLPSEAEWEWAASGSTDRHRKTRFPWGDETGAGCGLANLGRCPDRPAAAESVETSAWLVTDRSPFGVVGMLGNVSEWTRDAAARFDSDAWRGSKIDGASVEDDGARIHVTRGGSYLAIGGEGDLFTRTPFDVTRPARSIGFRCVYR